MTVRTATMQFPKAPKGEVAFLLLGAGVFTFGLFAVSTICVVCAHPATVAAFG